MFSQQKDRKAAAQLLEKGHTAENLVEVLEPIADHSLSRPRSVPIPCPPSVATEHQTSYLRPKTQNGSTKSASQKLLDDHFHNLEKSEILILSDGKVKCMPCCKVFETAKKFLVDQHLTTTKHTDNKDHWSIRQTRQHDIEKMLKEKMAESTLPIDTNVFRFQVVELFLQLKIPLSKLEGDFRRFLEFVSGNPLTDRRRLSSFIPMIRD